MNINTKQTTAIAVLTLFAYTANAQTAQIVADPGAPFLDAGLTITPAGAAGADAMTVDDTNATVGTQVDGVGATPNLLTFTTTNFEGTASGDNVTSTVNGGGTDSVIVNNDGITLNTVTSQTDTTNLDRYTRSVTTFDTNTLTSTTEFTAFATVAGTGPDGSLVYLVNDAFGPGPTSIADAKAQLDTTITNQDADDAYLAASGTVTAGAPTTSGGNLTVGGTLAVGANTDVEASIGVNAQAVTDLTNGAVANNTQGVADNAQAVTDLTNGAVANNTQGVADNAQAVTDLTNGAVADNAQAVTDLANGAVADNAQAVTDLANGAVLGNSDAITAMQDGNIVGSLANQIDENETSIEELAGIVISDELEAGETGIAGTITKKADGTIHIGENSLVTAEVGGVQQLFATDAGGNNIDIDVVGSNLRIDGDLVATELYADQGDAFVTAAFQEADAGLQRQITSNREDIDRNARGIAMVAALQHTTVLPGMSNALDVSAAHFEGETGLALNYARRISDNVQINFGAASTSDFDESVIKAGVGVQW
jgi:hypothetical protein